MANIILIKKIAKNYLPGVVLQPLDPCFLVYVPIAFPCLEVTL